MTVEDRIKIMSNIRSIYEPRMDPKSNYFAVVKVDTLGFDEKFFVRVKEEPGTIHLNNLIRVEVDPRTSNARLVSDIVDAESDYVERDGIIARKQFIESMEDAHEEEGNFWDYLLDESGAGLK